MIRDFHSSCSALGKIKFEHRYLKKCGSVQKLREYADTTEDMELYCVLNMYAWAGSKTQLYIKTIEEHTTGDLSSAGTIVFIRIILQRGGGGVGMIGCLDG